MNLDLIGDRTCPFVNTTTFASPFPVAGCRGTLISASIVTKHSEDVHTVAGRGIISTDNTAGAVIGLDLAWILFCLPLRDSQRRY